MRENSELMMATVGLRVTWGKYMSGTLSSNLNLL